ncbi:glycoside hydrolase family 47 protein [Athelia psychrophila]|uniref:alpha-1,2-Mannosidase n=1 Tax=Athelia psychrophila TaxID=1759441 RepID=A0A166A4Q6_9AGAM|nr:glycoside hydrolase family 47 protein [Fibularhizoctonia sp. CBS 109695]
MGLGRLCTIALLASSPTVWGQSIQKPGLAVPASAAAHKADVVNIFNASYTAYKKYAWGHDDLTPVSKSFTDGRNGWGASIADALGTMYIMGMTDFFEEAVNFTASVDFSKSQTPDDVSVFETTIRYLGGYLSAYELSGAKYPVLLEKAKEVADKMAYAWTGSSAIQYNSVNFATNTPDTTSTTGIAAAALTLEYATLSKHTGNDTYRQLAEGTVKAIMALPAPLPGLPAQGVDPATGKSVGGYVTWGGGSDSYFEYLIKYGRLTNTKDSPFVAAWQTAVDSSIKTLLRNSTVGNHLYLADYNEGDILHVGSHLACFYGGNWLMGGKMLNNQTIVDYGLQLTDACWNTYESTLTGIGPESFSFISSDGNYTGGDAPTAAQLAFYKLHGFYITGSDYILRPEVLESNFYAYRVTGDKKYLDRAVSAVKSIRTYLPTTVAYTGINDVNAAASEKIDDMESFWFAEVLKYLYLTFDDPSHISLDDWVFNTECHPFKAPATAASYATTTTMPAPAAAFKTQPGNPPVVSPNTLVPAAVKKILHMRRNAEHH